MATIIQIEPDGHCIKINKRSRWYSDFTRLLSIDDFDSNILAYSGIDI